MSVADSKCSSVFDDIEEDLIDRWIKADEAAEEDSLPRCLVMLNRARECSDASVDQATQTLLDPGQDAAAHFADNLEISTPQRIDRFRILQLIGRGSFGLVYLAHDEDLHRDVAVKVPRLTTLMDRQLRKRFLNESKAAARLDHPHILPVYEAGVGDTSAFIVMAYCEGGSLDDQLRDGRTLPQRCAAQIAATIADAIHSAHRCGVVHRDLKPSNLLLRSAHSFAENAGERSLADSIMIGDFGLATILSDVDQTLTRGAIGTPSYMSPEQARGDRESIGPASDLYSVGAILYRMLTGRPPVIGDGPLQTMRRIEDSAIVRPRVVHRGIDQDLEAICLKCLNKSPHQRYADGGELRDDLSRYLDGHPVRARRHHFGHTLSSWIRREPMVAALAFGVASLVTLIALGGSLAAVTFKRQRDDVQRLLQESESAKQDVESLVSVLRTQLDETMTDDVLLGIDAMIARGEATPDDYCNRAEWLLHRGRYAEAASDLETANAKWPNDRNTKDYLSWLLSSGPDDMVDPPRSLALIEEAIDGDPNPHWSLQHTLGYAQYANDHFQASLDTLNRAIAGNKGGRAIMWTYKAMALWQLDRRQEAGEALREALRLQVAKDEQGEFIDLNIRRAAAMLEVSLPLSP